MAYCRNCGKQLADTDRFCRYCGALQPAAEILERRCGSCGAQLEEGAIFCPECGYRVQGHDKAGLGKNELEETRLKEAGAGDIEPDEGADAQKSVKNEYSKKAESAAGEARTDKKAVRISNAGLPVLLVLLIFIFLTDQEKTRKKLQEFEKWWIFLLCCGIVLLIFTSLYIQWNAVRSELISVVHGSYFLPVLFLAFFLIYNHIKYNNRSNIKYYFSFAVFFNLYAIMECFLYHL